MSEDKKENQEELLEIKESLESIIDTIDEATLSLREEDLKKIVGALSEEVLFETVHELFDLAPEDVKEFAHEIENNAEHNIVLLKEIVLSVAENGLLPSRFINQKVQNILTNEIHSDDPEYIQKVNEVERISDFLALRYRLQTLLLEHYREDHPEGAEIEFENLVTSRHEDELIKDLEEAREDFHHVFDEHLIEYKLGKDRNYELEQMIFLSKKVIMFGGVEGKEVPGGLPGELEQMITEYNSKDYAVNQVTIDSVDMFSFQQFKIHGGVYNYAYFAEEASNSDFFHQPKFNDKPIMVLLHGMARDWAFWRHMIKELIPYYQIIAPDLNGYGDSDELVELHTLENYSAYVAKFLDKLGVEDYSIMGHSLGSFTTQQVLLNAGLPPKKAVMFSSAPFIELPTIAVLLNSLTKSFATNVIGKAITKVPQKLQQLITSVDQKMDKDNYYQRVIDKTSPRAIAEGLKDIAFDYHIKNYIQKNDAHYMIVSGASDKVIPAKATRKFKEFFPNSDFYELENTGHEDIITKFMEEKHDELFGYLGISELSK